MDKRKDFLKVFEKLQKKYGKANKRLAGEGWGSPWKTLIVTIMSAQSRDEMTIHVAKALFRRYGSLEKLTNARYFDVYRIFKRLNYNKTKAKNIIAAARYIKEEFAGKVPSEMEKLIKIPGVGRKTANLVLWECYGKHGICVDTHVHRLSNVLGFVRTKTPEETEKEMMKIVSKRLWGKVNRMLVLFGKDCPGRDKEKLLRKLEEINPMKQ